MKLDKLIVEKLYKLAIRLRTEPEIKLTEDERFFIANSLIFLNQHSLDYFPAAQLRNEITRLSLRIYKD